MNLTSLKNAVPFTADELLDETTTGGSPVESATPTPAARGRWSQVFRNAWNRMVSFYTRVVLEGIIFRKQLERFYLVFGGHIFFQTLHTAVKLDLFTLLDQHPGISCAEIAQRLNIEEQPARVVLLGLIASKMLKKKGDRYYNTTISRLWLTRTSPRNGISYVLLQNHGMYKAMPHLHEAVVANSNTGLKEFPGTEPTFYERLAHDPRLETIFQDAMQALSGQTNALLARFLDLSRVRHLVDVGGGNGSNIIALARKNPHLKATVFDFPTVCAMARSNIENQGLSDRLRAVPGNCFEQAFPENADAFLFCHFFTIWSKAKDLALLKKAHAALPEGGQAMIFNMMQDNDRSGPLSAAVGSPYFLTLATGEGMLYTWDEYEALFREAGFTKIKRIRLPMDHGVIIGIKGPTNA